MMFLDSAVIGSLRIRKYRQSKICVKVLRVLGLYFCSCNVVATQGTFFLHCKAILKLNLLQYTKASIEIQYLIMSNYVHISTLGQVTPFTSSEPCHKV